MFQSGRVAKASSYPMWKTPRAPLMSGCGTKTGWMNLHEAKVMTLGIWLYHRSSRAPRSTGHSHWAPQRWTHFPRYPRAYIKVRLVLQNRFTNKKTKLTTRNAVVHLIQAFKRYFSSSSTAFIRRLVSKNCIYDEAVKMLGAYVLLHFVRRSSRCSTKQRNWLFYPSLWADNTLSSQFGRSDGQGKST